MGSGGPLGLQNRCSASLAMSRDGSFPSRPRQLPLSGLEDLRFDVAVEINSRPERLDPPKRLLRLAVEAGCGFAIDTDAHAPEQLGWQMRGCERAAACGVAADTVINRLSATNLVAWADRD